MKDLITIKEQEGKQLVSARELYEFLEVRRDFTNWCKQMFEYGFEEGEDYSLANSGERYAHNKIDYALTLDCAKHIAMVQRTEKGRQARDYFIACEKRLKNLAKGPAPSAAQALLQTAQALLEQEQKLAALSCKQTQLADKQRQLEASFQKLKPYIALPYPGYQTIQGYANLYHYKIDKVQAGSIRRLASSMCRMRRLEIHSVPDARHGAVNICSEEVLAEVFIIKRLE